MAYQRKTRDVYEVYGLYENGWEYLTTELTSRQAIQRRKEYIENEHISVKIKRKRIKKEN